MPKFLRDRPLGASVFIRQLQFAFAKEILPRVREACASKSLKGFLQYYETFDGKAVIGVPHYWAAYYNDGHGGFGPRGGKYLVWFRDPLSDDPRLGGSYPIRYSDWRPLTKQEFRTTIDLNIALGGPPLVGPFAIIVPNVGPRAGTHFFEEGFTNYLASGGSTMAAERFSRYVKRFVIDQKDTVTIPAIKFQ